MDARTVLFIGYDTRGVADQRPSETGGTSKGSKDGKGKGKGKEKRETKGMDLRKCHLLRRPWTMQFGIYGGMGHQNNAKRNVCKQRFYFPCLSSNMASVRAKAPTYHTLGLFPRFVVHLWRERDTLLAYSTLHTHSSISSSSPRYTSTFCRTSPFQSFLREQARKGGMDRLAIISE